MNDRLDVFISSTISDLRQERKAVSEMILRSGHFPVHQENFVHGYQEIKEVIEKHLCSSQLYLLVLAGKYGSIEPKSGLSYTEFEFNLAKQLGKKICVIVLTDEYILKNNKDPYELEMNDPRYQRLKDELVNSGKFVNYVSNIQNIELVVNNTLNDIAYSA